MEHLAGGCCLVKDLEINQTKIIEKWQMPIHGQIQ